MRFTSTEVDILKKSHEKAKSSSTGNVRWGTVLNYFLDFCKREKFTKTHSLVYDRSCEALESKWKEMKKKSISMLSLCNSLCYPYVIPSEFPM